MKANTSVKLKTFNGKTVEIVASEQEIKMIKQILKLARELDKLK